MKGTCGGSCHRILTTTIEPERTCRLRRTARNHVRFIRLMPLRSSPSHKSAAFITATNGLPPNLCGASRQRSFAKLQTGVAQRLFGRSKPYLSDPFVRSWRRLGANSARGIPTEVKPVRCVSADQLNGRDTLPHWVGACLFVVNTGLSIVALFGSMITLVGGWPDRRALPCRRLRLRRRRRASRRLYMRSWRKRPRPETAQFWRISGPSGEGRRPDGPIHAGRSGALGRN